MKSQDKVLKLFPNAFVERGDFGRSTPKFRVTIKPGRYAYGRLKSWAWVAALESIQEDNELSKGAQP